LGLSGVEVERQQRNDLKRATDFVREVTGVQRIETYFARQMEGHIRFEEMEL
jgi:hypothetical protein